MASSDENDERLVVTDEDLQDLARELTKEWTDLARNLKIPKGKIYAIKRDNRENEKETILEMLFFWKSREGGDATYEVLAEALSKADRRDLSNRLKKGMGRKRLREDEPASHEATSFGSKQRRTEWSAGGEEPVKAGLKRKKREFLRELKNKYSVLCGDIQPVPFLKDKYNIDKLYVESGIKILEEKGMANTDQEKWRKLEDYKSVFTDPQITSNRRIIDGGPGYGKSTLALKMTHDWCQETAPMEKFEILILLRLRQFKSVPTIFSAIKKFLLPKDSELTEDDITSILNSSSTLILLDGYDEYPHRGNAETDIENIIRGDMFQKHVVVLTTRTSCLPSNYRNAINVRFRLTGFDEDARKSFIQKVADGSSDVSEKINKFLKEDPVSVDFCKIPLFFTMISYMVMKNKKLQNLKTVTDFFKNIIKCFFSHNDGKKTEGDRQGEIDHSRLDEVTFEGLRNDVQKISWDTNELVGKIGQDVYKENVRIGILIEEEDFDFDTLEYKTETRFFHKLFAEWRAAHYFSKLVAKPETELEPWPQEAVSSDEEDTPQLQEAVSSDEEDTPQPQEAVSNDEEDTTQPQEAVSTDVENTSQPQAVSSDEENTSQPPEAVSSDKEHLLKFPNPDGLRAMHRFACGLNRDAAVKIIKHLGTKGSFHVDTLLCITEFSDSIETLEEETIKLICRQGLFLEGVDSSLYEKSVIEVLKLASSRKIYIERVELYDCLIVGNDGNLYVKPSNLPLPRMNCFGIIKIVEKGRIITEEQIYTILQYLLSTGVHDEEWYDMNCIRFDGVLLPRCIRVTELLSNLCRRGYGGKVQVKRIMMETQEIHCIFGWGLETTEKAFGLNLESGQWEYWWHGDCEVMTDEEYQKEEEYIKMRAEEQKKYQQLNR